MFSGLNFSMHLMLNEKQDALEPYSEALPQTPINPGSKLLRRAVRKNIVSFPAQIPAFAKQPPDGAQWRMVLLYFVRGWNLRGIAERFKVPPHRVCQILNNWSIRALALGYVEIIDPEAFAECCRMDIDYGTDREQEKIQMAEREPSPEQHPQRLPEGSPEARAPLALLSVGTQPGDFRSELPARSAKVVDALDAAIAHCEEWSDEFWLHTATLLRDLREVAAAALELQCPVAPADGRFTTFQGGKDHSQQELQQSDEEHISHAVA